jgi:hypothetical protein
MPAKALARTHRFSRVIALLVTFFAIAMALTYFLPTKWPHTNDQQTGSRATDVTGVPAHSAIADYVRLPLGFEPNLGQAQPATRFVAHGNGYSISLTASAARFVLPTPGVRDKSTSAQSVAFEMAILGANPQSRPVGRSQLPGKVNYFIGSKPESWRTDIPTYARVEYAAVYPDIDLVYYGSEGRLEHDFVVHPGARPDTIRLKYSGVGRVRLASNGDLLLDVRGHEIRQQAAVIYQRNKDGVRDDVRGRYVLYANNEVSFRVALYDQQRPLIIDPALVYSTFLGGSGQDAANAMAIDSDGNAYIAGSTTSADFPTTPGAFQENDPTPTQHYSHPFVAKLNATGTALVYSTYLGGIADESATSIAVDTTGNAFVAGYTGANNFPTTPNSLQPHFAGCRFIQVSTHCKGFLTKLNPTGSALLYSTYLGGTDQDEITALAIDSGGVVYLTGTTYSNDFPTTPGALKTTFDHNGAPPDYASNAFVTKIDPSRAGIAGLIYSTYLGGTNAAGKAIAVDPTGAAYVTGTALVKDFPVTPGAFRSPGAIWIAKLNLAGSALIYGATLGTGNARNGTGIHPAPGEASKALVVDTAGNAYVTGTAYTPDFPVTPGAFQTTLPGRDAGFVAKLDPSATTLVYSTFLGGMCVGGPFRTGKSPKLLPWMGLGMLTLPALHLLMIFLLPRSPLIPCARLIAAAWSSIPALSPRDPAMLSSLS